MQTLNFFVTTTHLFSLYTKWVKNLPDPAEKRKKKQGREETGSVIN